MNIPIFIVKKIMGRDSLFQRVKNSIRGQKSSFCSRSTSVTLLESGRAIPRNLVVNYIDCGGYQKVVNYEEVLRNNNYIPDCVQGGCPISIINGGDIVFPVDPYFNDGGTPIEPQPTQSYKSFVQYGTTNCDTPPPPSVTSIILTPCNLLGENYIVDPTGYDGLMQGGVYLIQLNPLSPLGVSPQVQCYTVGEQTGISAEYNIIGQVENVGDCYMCRKKQ